MSATPSTSLSRKRRSLPSPLSAVITRSPKKRRTVSSVSASSTQKLTGFSEFQLERFLLNLSPYNGSEVITSDESSTIHDFISEIVSQGTRISTQFQLMLITTPLLARVCTIVEKKAADVNLFVQIEPREEILHMERGVKPRYGDCLLHYQKKRDSVVDEDDTSEDDDDTTGKEEVGTEQGDQVWVVYYGSQPLVLHEVDVNVTVEKLRVKGIEGVQHLFEDYPLVQRILLLVTDMTGSTHTMEMSREVKYPISYKEFLLLEGATHIEPKLNVKNCAGFLSYVSSWVYDSVTSNT